MLFLHYFPVSKKTLTQQAFKENMLLGLVRGRTPLTPYAISHPNSLSSDMLPQECLPKKKKHRLSVYLPFRKGKELQPGLQQRPRKPLQLDRMEPGELAILKRLSLIATSYVQCRVAFCYARLQAPKPKSSKYPKELKTLGDHIRKRRINLGLLQREVAEEIGVSKATIYNWENHRTKPPDRYIGGIMEFLAYKPLPHQKLFGKALKGP